MEKYIVTYEIANQLANLGFNEGCFYAYHKPVDKDAILDGALDFLDYTNKFFTKEHIEYANANNYHCILAPTREQVLTWLREEHSIEITIFPIFGRKCGYDSFKRYGWDKSVLRITKCQFLDYTMYNQNISDRSELENLNDYDSYNEALDSGILDALKLIKK